MIIKVYCYFILIIDKKKHVIDSDSLLYNESSGIISLVMGSFLLLLEKLLLQMLALQMDYLWGWISVRMMTHLIP